MNVFESQEKEESKSNPVEQSIFFEDSFDSFPEGSRSVYLARFNGDIPFEKTNKRLDEQKKIKTSASFEFIFDR
jgi:hypothetical protein